MIQASFKYVEEDLTGYEKELKALDITSTIQWILHACGVHRGVVALFTDPDKTFVIIQKKHSMYESALSVRLLEGEDKGVEVLGALIASTGTVINTFTDGPWVTRCKMIASRV